MARLRGTGHPKQGGDSGLSELSTFVIVGLQVLVLVNVLLVQAMLKNHHDKTANHRGDEPDEPVE